MKIKKLIPFFRLISVWVLIAFVSPEAAHRPFSHLAPATTTHYGLAEKSLSELRALVSAYSPAAISERSRILNHLADDPRSKKSNALLDSLKKNRPETEEAFRETSAPFELFLIEGRSGYFYAMAYLLLWENAPTESEKKRLFELLVDLYRPEYGRYWKNILSHILMNSESTGFSAGTTQKLENILMLFEETRFDGLFRSLTLSLRDPIIEFFTQHPSQIHREDVALRVHPFVRERFLDQPTGESLAFLMRDLFWEPRVTGNFTGRDAETVEALAETLLEHLETVFDVPASPEETSDDPEQRQEENFIQSFLAGYPASIVRSFQKLAKKLKDSEGQETLVLHRRKVMPDEPDAVNQAEITFQGWPLINAVFRHVTGKEKKHSEDQAVLEANQKQLWISFSQTFQNRPPSLILETYSEEGLVTEEFLFEADGPVTYINSEGEKTSFEDLVGSYYINENTLFVDLTSLLNSLDLQGLESRNLSFFYEAPVADRTGHPVSWHGKRSRPAEEPESNGTGTHMLSFNPFIPLLLGVDFLGWLEEHIPVAEKVSIPAAVLLVIGAISLHYVARNWSDIKSGISTRWEKSKEHIASLIVLGMMPVLFVVVVGMMLFDAARKGLHSVKNRFREWVKKFSKEVPVEDRIWNFIINPKFFPPDFKVEDQAGLAIDYEEIDLTLAVEDHDIALAYTKRKKWEKALVRTDRVIRTYEHVLRQAEYVDLQLFSHHLLHVYLLKVYILLRQDDRAQAAQFLKKADQLAEAFPIVTAHGFFGNLAIPVQIKHFMDRLDDQTFFKSLFETAL